MINWKTGVEKILSKRFNKQVKIASDISVGGGSINDAREVQTTAGKFFVKINSASRFPEMFNKEAMGIQILASTKTIATPVVIGFGEEDNAAFLVLKYIESVSKIPGFWEIFGTQMASLHRQTNKRFGLDHDNFIGSIPQTNNFRNTWEDFFRGERLEPQISMAFNLDKIDRTLVKMFDRFFIKLDNLFPKEPPALIHGDLWGGNFMVNECGNPVIIDPAVYYGHREMDIAMSKLFGGFAKQFYDAYHKAFPLENGWQERMNYCNLYPLMVHVNLFGGGYAGSVKNILKRF